MGLEDQGYGRVHAATTPAITCIRMFQTPLRDEGEWIENFVRL